METELKTAKSLHLQVADILDAEIRADKFARKLPSVRTLADRFGVSTMTIVGALELLQRRKLVERVAGKGVFLRGRNGQTAKLAPRTANIAVFCYDGANGTSGDPYYSEVLSGMVQSAAEQSYRLTFVNLARGEELAAIRRTQADLRLDGGLLLAMTDRKVLEKLGRLKIPFVLADHHYPGLPMDCVTLDSFTGAREAVRHLVELGHREIGTLTSRIANNPERWDGYRQALLDAGIDPAAQLVRSTTSAREGGYDAIRALLASGQPLPRALFIWGGMMALGALQALREAGRRVPEDISIVTSTNPRFQELYPDITAAVGDAAALGSRAVELLRMRMEGSDRPAETVMIPMPVRVGVSTRAL